MDKERKNIVESEQMRREIEKVVENKPAGLRIIKAANDITNTILIVPDLLIS